MQKGWRMILRHLQARDAERAVELAHATQVFRPVELAVLREVLDDYMQAPEGQGYYALVAELLPWQEPLLSGAELAAPDNSEGSCEVADLSVGTGEAKAASPLGVVGFVIFGPTPLTAHAWDLYWIVVARPYQRWGIGSRLLEAAEIRIRAQRGEIVRVETSGSPTYAATRRFYAKHGYQQAGVIPDFYAPGDDLVIYFKRLPIPPANE
ncbi:hypothetical protein HRbin36_00452 [bacterium HR36]|nr:hypothetical protein HRbin36_00452 [bacterium HR36]